MEFPQNSIPKFPQKKEKKNRGAVLMNRKKAESTRCGATVRLQPKVFTETQLK